MGSFTHALEFSIDQPNLFSECVKCQYVIERIKSESERSLAKYGKLDVHKLTITCEGSILDQKVMWATHDGIRYPQSNVPGLVDGILLFRRRIRKLPNFEKIAL